jgi:imidazolonepropionase-like amidohydrolase
MVRIRVFVLILLLSVYLRAFESQTELPAPPLVFLNATVVDAKGAPTKPNMTVVVTGDRITALGPTVKVRVPKNAQVIDGKGKFLMPGLWDMHVHSVINPAFAGNAYETMLPLFIINGITGVRDTHGDLELGKRMKAEIAEGKRVGPRMFVSGKLIDGPKPIIPGSTSVRTVAEARQAVVDLKTGGADFVKVYSRLPRDLYFAIVDECKKQGMTFAGHVPYSVSAAEASDAGQKSIEHLTGILMASSTNETVLRQKMVESSEQPPHFGEFLESEYLPLESYNQEKATGLFERFARNKTYQVPTFVLLLAIGERYEVNREAVGYKYLPPSLRTFWSGMSAGMPESTTPEDIAGYKRVAEKSFEIVGQMHHAGVPILAGTDTPNPNIYPGFSLHDELALMVKAGLTPMEALETATRNPARYFGKEKELGTVEAGKLADLLLLDADPLADIQNTRKISAVVANGRFFGKETLQKMLTDIEASNREHETK